MTVQRVLAILTNGIIPPEVIPATQAEIDFGKFPRRSGSFVIADPLVQTTTTIVAYQTGTAATGRQADENEMDAIVVRAVAGPGQLTIFADCLTGKVSGKYRVSYVLGKPI